MTDGVSWPQAIELLTAPFPWEDVEWRVAREVPGDRVHVLAYLDARAVEGRLDEVFGPFGWQTEVTFGPNGAMGCKLSVQMPDGSWVAKSNAADGTDIEATKGGYSTAFKRAAAHGLGIGRYLYEMGETIVQLKATGQHTHRTKDGRWLHWDAPTQAQILAGAGAVSGDATGAEQQAQPAPAPAAGAAPPAPAVACPRCHGPMWDNRDSKRSPKAPDYKCKNKACDGAIWLKPKVD